MTINRLARPSDGAERVTPPSGDSEDQKAERVRFWIERGNQKLAEMDKGHLHWVHANGHYWIEERAETYRQTMLARAA